AISSRPSWTSVSPDTYSRIRTGPPTGPNSSMLPITGGRRARSARAPACRPGSAVTVTCASPAHGEPLPGAQTGGAAETVQDPQAPGGVPGGEHRHRVVEVPVRAPVPVVAVEVRQDDRVGAGQVDEVDGRFRQPPAH